MTGSRPAGEGPLTLQAPAKINLHLAVRGRRPDGYHELVTVLQTIDLCDVVSLRERQRQRDAAPGAPDVRLRLSAGGPAAAGGNRTGESRLPPRAGGDVPPDASNLAVRAALALLAEAGAAGEVGLDIALEKHIPAGGGLGGGSSDAAAVLRGLNALLGSPCGADTLAALAAQLGSDVTFFLQGGTALCTGRGEIVRPLPPPQPFALTLLVPPFAVPTPAVYAALRAAPAVPADATELAELQAAVAAADTRRLNNLYRNDLEPAARAVSPPLSELLDRTGLHLSGSGSTLFGYGELAREFSAACPSALICYAHSTSGNR